MNRIRILSAAIVFFPFFLLVRCSGAAEPDAQPLCANVERVLQSLEFLGKPLPPQVTTQIRKAVRQRDSKALTELLEPQVMFLVSINPELRVKVARGMAEPLLYQNGFTPVLVKVVNDAKVSLKLNIESPQAGAVYAGPSVPILERQQQTELARNENSQNDPGRFLQVEIYEAPPMTERLSGFAVEYSIALIYSSESGEREATIGFNIGQGTQELGFRSETSILFKILPAMAAKLSILDSDGLPTIARLTFRDSQGRIYPPQPKRLAPDLFFEPQIYRKHGETVRLPPGKFNLTYSRGPEYIEKQKQILIDKPSSEPIQVQLERWIDPMKFGFVSGDHHIHGAGCSHYTLPTQGVTPDDMFRQVKGEALNVGCVLTWGPCFEYQRRYFAPGAATISEPLTVLKYDLEISGFGSAALGHVCLLNLTNQTYPGSEGTSSKGWPSWTVPVLKWAKEQGGVTGYPHSDLFVEPSAYAKRAISRHDKDGDGLLARDEVREMLLPGPFEQIDSDEDGKISAAELARFAERESNQLPNFVLPAMRGSGAMEIFVSTVEGVCDFISAMNTGRVGEWNTWYHLMNCGFPLKVSGETDFPCMSSRRVGQGRVYVKMSDHPMRKIDFREWCQALARGRSYVSDGYAHALEFTVNGEAPGFSDVRLTGPAVVKIRAKIAFAPETPKAVAHGTLDPAEGRRFEGDTRVLHGPRSEENVRGGQRLIEVVLNGRVAAHANVPADGQMHDLSFELKVKESSWLALRHFPQLHTNPVNVFVREQPIRASSESAAWCAESVELLWENRSSHIASAERPTARISYDRAIAEFRKRAAEAKARAVN